MTITYFNQWKCIKRIYVDFTLITIEAKEYLEPNGVHVHMLILGLFGFGIVFAGTTKK